MKYYDSTMSTNMSKNVLATTATITSKEAIPKFKGTITHMDIIVAAMMKRQQGPSH